MCCFKRWWSGASSAPLVLSLVCLLAPGWLGTATTATAQDAKDDRIARPELRATRTATPPVLDGDVRGDDAWLGAMEARRFIQNTPDEGQPASQETAVYVVYDDTTLYIGVVCFDLEPDRIIVSDSRRDASLSESDSFQVILDTFGDHQTGFVFGTNPAGIQYDGQVNRDGEGGIGTSGGFNLNWDGEWEVQTQVFADGWGAELAIPFRTLRFPKGNPQSWGLNFQRNIRRHNESAFWAPLPRQFGINRVSLAGTLHGLEVPRQRVLQVIPYVLGEAAEGLDTAAGGESSTDEDFEAGFDLKYSVTASLTLDATYNTDFAQVEADVQQINLDRFNLFFPEKRPFFLENAGAFSVGVPEEVELFFSRRIGIGDGGSDVPIEGGLRLSGKAGRTNVGLLVMGTDDVPGVTPDNTFGVIRLSRDLGTKSSVGMIVTERRGRAALGEDRESRRTFGIDGRWGIGQRRSWWVLSPRPKRRMPKGTNMLSGSVADGIRRLLSGR